MTNSTVATNGSARRKSPIFQPRSSIARRAFPIAVCLLLAACECGQGGVSGTTGQLEITPGQSVDVGKVRVGETKSVDLILTNHGRVTIGIEKVDREGLSTSWGLGQVPKQIAPNLPTKVTVTFAPDDVGVQTGTLIFRTDSDKQKELRVSLRGEGVRTNVVIEPPAIDFGAVEVGSQDVKSIHLKNIGPIAEDVQLTGLADGSAHFRVGPIPGDGEVVHLEPGAEADLPVVFIPQWIDPAGFTASVDMDPCSNCETVSVPLSGVGVAALLTLQPSDCVDFGEVNPGSRVTKPIMVKNVGTLGLNVQSAVLAEPSTVFSIEGTYPLSVPPGGSAEIAVTYAPTALTEDQAAVAVSTDDPKVARVTVCLKGRGGGPDLSVSPPSLAFGTVAVGTSLTRNVRISNVGVGSGQTPLQVTRAWVRSGAGPFTNAAASISLMPGHSTTLAVTFAPTVEGAAADTLVLETNDADSLTREIPLTGTGRILPPCQLEVVPGALDFGNVATGRTATLPFALKNAGPGDCVVHDLALDSTSDAAFTLTGGARAEDSIAPGAVLRLTVKFSPTASRAYTGGMTFQVSDPVTPTRHVALSGTSIKGCLMLAPDELNFGTLVPACASRELVVNVYNTCSAAVVLQSVTLADQPDSPFSLVNVPALPVTLDGSAAPAIRVKFAPPVSGDYVGGLYVTSDERPEPYFVGLTGHGSTDGLQHDAFQQQFRPKVDVLFVIDNSGSMQEEQAALGSNFTAFMKYANSRNIDYHIAVTTTDMTVTGAHGRFIPLDGSRPKVLTPATPNVISVFADNVNVGTNGDGNYEEEFAPVYAATQPALLLTDNDGFLRSDAMFSVIAVTDEEDRDRKSVDYYYSYLLNIKGASHPELFTFSAVCQIDPAAGDSYGARLMEMARRTGGITTDIETSNWSRDLEKLGQLAFGYQTSFALGATPADVSQIQVTVDGMSIPANDPGGAMNWEYDPVEKKVNFDPLMAPEPGSKLEIDYPVACTTP